MPGPANVPPLDPPEMTAAEPPVPRTRRLIALGLGVRLLGVGLIWAGDGSPATWRKGVVVLGVLLSVGGIAVLRYLLLAPLFSRWGARRRRA
jgi:hypothetical protein